jgi:hypothetical protein
MPEEQPVMRTDFMAGFHGRRAMTVSKAFSVSPGAGKGVMGFRQDLPARQGRLHGAHGEQVAVTRLEHAQEAGALGQGIEHGDAPGFHVAEDIGQHGFGPGSGKNMSRPMATMAS